MLADRMKKLGMDMATLEHDISTDAITPTQTVDRLEMFRRRMTSIEAELKRREAALKVQRARAHAGTDADLTGPAPEIDTLYAGRVAEFKRWFEAFMNQQDVSGAQLATVLERGAVKTGVNTHTARRYLMSVMYADDPPRYRIYQIGGSKRIQKKQTDEKEAMLTQLDAHIYNTFNSVDNEKRADKEPVKQPTTKAQA